MAFVPCSGPFARGIHATIHAELNDAVEPSEILQAFQDAYAASPSIQVGTKPPTLKDVVGSNRCHLGVAVNGQRVVVTSVIDNLVKGAAGGGVHWMNRRLGFDPQAGLLAPAFGF